MGFNKSGGSGNNNNNNNSNPLDNSLSYRAQNKKLKKKRSEAFTGDGSG